MKRLPSLVKLKELLDINKLIFHFSDKSDSTTRINADYISKCIDGSGTVFVFIIENNGNMRCVSLFPMNINDYTQF